MQSESDSVSRDIAPGSFPFPEGPCRAVGRDSLEVPFHEPDLRLPTPESAEDTDPKPLFGRIQRKHPDVRAKTAHKRHPKALSASA